MSTDNEPVSPITTDDHIDPANARSPEISEQGGAQFSFGDAPKHEHSDFDPVRPKQTKTGLSWRTRLAGANRTPSVNVAEVENGTISTLSLTTH
jgi:hypothetical protein